MNEQAASKVPKIRFKGFADEWNTLTLGELGKVATNKRVFIHQTTSTGDVPFYKIGTFGREPKLFISQSLFDTYKERFPYPEKGDLLISVIGSIGRIVEYTGKDEYFQDSNIVWLQHNGAVVNAFLKQFYSFVKWSGLEGSTIKHLYNKNILETQIDLPCQKEQAQIGEYFRELDSLIGLHQRKHDKLVTLKKAMLQKMFPQPGVTTPEIRFKGFSGNWESKRIDEIAPLQRGFDLPTTTVRQGPYPVVYSNGILRTHDEYKCVAPGVITGRSGTIGKVTFVSENYWPHNTSLWVTNFFHNDPLFIHYFYVQFRLDRFNAGSTIPTLNRNDVHAIRTNIPCPAEQQKIGTYFRTLDALISKHAIQLQKLQQIKSAFLEKMFV